VQPGPGSPYARHAFTGSATAGSTPRTHARFPFGCHALVRVGMPYHDSPCALLDPRKSQESAFLRDPFNASLPCPPQSHNRRGAFFPRRGKKLSVTPLACKSHRRHALPAQPSTHLAQRATFFPCAMFLRRARTRTTAKPRRTGGAPKLSAVRTRRALSARSRSTQREPHAACGIRNLSLFHRRRRPTHGNSATSSPAIVASARCSPMSIS
jgi:hypothetical protein